MEFGFKMTNLAAMQNQVDPANAEGVRFGHLQIRGADRIHDAPLETHCSAMFLFFLLLANKGVYSKPDGANPTPQNVG
jgi:hypothetical protein